MGHLAPQGPYLRSTTVKLIMGDAATMMTLGVSLEAAYLSGLV